MISNREIEEILKQDREATPGPWAYQPPVGLGSFSYWVLNLDMWRESVNGGQICKCENYRDEGRADAELIANYRNQMRRVVERLKRCEKALRWYADAMNYTAVARYSDNAYACPIADDDGTRARSYFSEVDGGEG